VEGDVRRAALAAGLLLGACFQGHGLWGERCASDDDCGPGLGCQEDGVCAEAPACEELEIAAADLRPRVVLLLDHSLSMRRCLDGEHLDVCATSGGPQPNRWDALGSLVTTVVAQVGEEVALAAVVFPRYNPEPQFQCALDESTAAPFGPQANAQIVAMVRPDPAREPDGENPAREAWKRAREMIEASIGPAVPPRRIVLITDNPPNCPAGATDLAANTEQLDPELTGLLAQGAAEGIPTIVVGVTIRASGDRDKTIGGADAHLYLSALAEAGGAAQPEATPFLDLADSTTLAPVTEALTATLAGLAAGGEDCRVHLAEPLERPEQAAVGLAGRLRREDRDCADPQGWRWVDAAHTTLEMCSQLCADVRAGARARVRVGCR
jgi:hypothetical protein